MVGPTYHHLSLIFLSFFYPLPLLSLSSLISPLTAVGRLALCHHKLPAPAFRELVGPPRTPASCRPPHSVGLPELGREGWRVVVLQGLPELGLRRVRKARGVRQVRLQLPLRRRELHEHCLALPQLCGNAPSPPSRCAFAAPLPPAPRHESAPPRLHASESNAPGAQLRKRLAMGAKSVVGGAGCSVRGEE
ncbi:hypothetical protein PVAP13_8NG330756 [Panicum virgatum]|uniref:Uncharacterized protein n=1 Tax=Panicum virgatum TaxID=38727 RepID=A0A8T0PD34_PANVG|nr:hypothetical protein PVAP13_8NG330756 [Panicum virgatum]